MLSIQAHLGKVTLYQIVMLAGQKKSGLTEPCPPWPAGAFGWKETKKSLKIVILLFRWWFKKLWDC
jgi:hypothetical protein